MSNEKQVETAVAADPITAEEQEEAAIERFEAIEDSHPGTYRLRQNLVDFAYEEYAERVVTKRPRGGGLKMNRRALTGELSDTLRNLKYNPTVRNKVNRLLCEKYHAFVIDLNTLLTNVVTDATASPVEEEVQKAT